MAGMDRIYYTLNGFYHTIIVLLYTRYSVVSVQQERGRGGRRGKNVPSDERPLAPISSNLGYRGTSLCV